MAVETGHHAWRQLALARHPIYPMLLPIPVLCFAGALVTDIVYSRTANLMWLDFSSWLLLAGLVGGGIAGVVLIVVLVRAGSTRDRLGAHVALLLAAWIVEVFNSFVHARDGWTAVVPGGLWLSLLATVLALLAGWTWRSATFEARSVA